MVVSPPLPTPFKVSAHWMDVKAQKPDKSRWMHFRSFGYIYRSSLDAGVQECMFGKGMYFLFRMRKELDVLKCWDSQVCTHVYAGTGTHTHTPAWLSSHNTSPWSTKEWCNWVTVSFHPGVTVPTPSHLWRSGLRWCLVQLKSELNLPLCYVAFNLEKL